MQLLLVDRFERLIPSPLATAVMELGLACQVNGLGSQLCAATKRFLTSCGAMTEGNTPRSRRRLASFVDAAGRDPTDPGFLDDRHQRLLAGLAGLEEGREVRALTQLRDAQLERAEPRVERAGAMAVAVVEPLRRAFVPAGADHAFHVGLHQQLQHRLGDRSQEVAVVGLLQQLDRALCRWHFQRGGGPEYCRACQEDKLPCARSEPGAGGRCCPYREHALISHQEHEAWDVLLACLGQLRLAPSGLMIGIDMDAGLKIGAARGCDLAVLSELLPAAEAGLADALNARAE